MGSSSIYQLQALNLVKDPVLLVVILPEITTYNLYPVSCPRVWRTSKKKIDEEMRELLKCVSSALLPHGAFSPCII